VADRCVEDPLL